ncbi:hypothetical protein M132_0687 [Bacteroides fragilis str. S24L15]|nr:hypothetical protein M132_0687 [Bacteroides fragilis str. S24L15]EYA77278.1 hypothetical protein M133_0741 [Bacteroides fragilis str. S24L26]EYA81762.1 hypothetical protein M134_0832 [Bacteroides fragilis str. S24L34]
MHSNERIVFSLKNSTPFYFAQNLKFTTRLLDYILDIKSISTQLVQPKNY